MSGLPIYVFFVIASLIVSIMCFNYNKDKGYLRLFPFFLAATVLVEWLADKLWSNSSSNAVIYNFFTIVEFVFYLFILYSIIENSAAKKIIIGVIFVYVPASLINIFFFQGLNSLHTITYSIGCLSIVGGCILYFFEVFRARQIINLLHEPGFWISSGLLFFYSCTFPYYALTDLLKGSAPFILNNFWTILNVLNILLYTLFTIAFVCRIKVRKSTS
jgi:hypothetical protein